MGGRWTRRGPRGRLGRGGRGERGDRGPAERGGVGQRLPDAARHPDADVVRDTDADPDGHADREADRDADTDRVGAGGRSDLLGRRCGLGQRSRPLRGLRDERGHRGRAVLPRWRDARADRQRDEDPDERDRPGGPRRRAHHPDDRDRRGERQHRPRRARRRDPDGGPRLRLPGGPEPRAARAAGEGATRQHAGDDHRRRRHLVECRRRLGPDLADQRADHRVPAERDRADGRRRPREPGGRDLPAVPRTRSAGPAWRSARHSRTPVSSGPPPPR